MHFGKSIIDGLKILAFDRETIKYTAREKSLEDIFLNTLFLNYLIVLITYFYSILVGGFTINGRVLNMPVFFAILMVYPFAYNLIIYILYGFFGIMAELVNTTKKIKPLLSTGFHTAIVYAILIYIITLLSTIDSQYGIFMLIIFTLYFLYTMFVSISTIYNYSFPQTIIVLLTPIFIIGLIILIIMLLYPALPTKILTSLLI